MILKRVILKHFHTIDDFAKRKKRKNQIPGSLLLWRCIDLNILYVLPFKCTRFIVISKYNEIFKKIFLQILVLIGMQIPFPYTIIRFNRINFLS